MGDLSRDSNSGTAQVIDQSTIGYQLAGDPQARTAYQSVQLRGGVPSARIDRDVDQRRADSDDNAWLQARGSQASLAYPESRDAVLLNQRLQGMLDEYVATVLNQSLADCAVLQLQCRQASWNTMASGLQPLSYLFGEIESVLADHAQHLAERIIRLGGIAHGTLAAIGERSGLSEYPVTPHDWQVDVTQVLSALDIISDALDDEIDLLVDIGDERSSDLIDAVSRSAERYIEYLSSYEA